MTLQVLGLGRIWSVVVILGESRILKKLCFGFYVSFFFNIVIQF